ncbi:LOW QUALITY PROTEIN: metal transporter CNNM3 [Chelonia mydas]|uniref:LOW QUALITY PROTEIN: metal transporter CNNM3 n=1 Tax=Chelonia mydas TaxID=8469 RepID=UPI001CA98F17|nr:LOW QUALITY PROTEIN: metal transporter CNNM3 [Chelonia mydas]
METPVFMPPVSSEVCWQWLFEQGVSYVPIKLNKTDGSFFAELALPGPPAPPPAPIGRGPSAARSDWPGGPGGARGESADRPGGAHATRGRPWRGAGGCAGPWPRCAWAAPPRGGGRRPGGARPASPPPRPGLPAAPAPLRPRPGRPPLALGPRRAGPRPPGGSRGGASGRPRPLPRPPGCWPRPRPRPRRPPRLLPPPPAPWLLPPLLALLLALSALLRALQLGSLWPQPAELGPLRGRGSEAGQALARPRGPFALCSLLLLSSLANAALAVLACWALRALAPAILAAAGLVFLLAELLPFAVWARWGQALAPRGRWLTRLCMLLTCPVSLPLSKLLELALRRDASPCLLREKLAGTVRGSDPYDELVREEFSKGALRSKTVEDVLTPLDQCFMLNANSVLDFRSMSMIMQSGYTRIPIYEEERTNLVDMLYLKDLALVDPDDCVPLSTISKFYNHPLHFVFNDTKLDAVLEEFKRGKSHLAIVQKVNSEGEGDPFYEAMGLVTLEDVIEEIIRSEILDESDDYKENKVRKRPAPMGTLLEHRKEDFSLFKGCDNEHKVKISPQLLLATQRFLSREVDLFSPARISEKVLLHLLRHPSVSQEVKFNERDRLAPEHYLYQRSQPVDYFVLVLQGRLEVEIGKEGLKFENGAFTYYGVSALTAPSSVHQSPASTLRPNRCEQPLDCSESTAYPPYCPDYTVRALTDLQFIKVTRLQYLNALMASRIQPSPQSPDSVELKIVPNSQTKLLDDRNTVPAADHLSLALRPATRSLLGTPELCS